MPSADPNNSSPQLCALDRAEIAFERATAALQDGDFLEAANWFYLAKEAIKDSDAMLAYILDMQISVSLKAFSADRLARKP